MIAPMRARGIDRFNIPNKNRNERQHLLDSIATVTAAFGEGIDELTDDVATKPADICCHFSLAYQYDRTEERTYQHFKSFMAEAAERRASA